VAYHQLVRSALDEANHRLFVGCRSVQTTLNVDTHVVQETQRKAIEHLERVLFPSVPKLAPAGESGQFVIE
jgi:hypothetical protein